MSHYSNPSIDGPDITNYWQYFNLDRDPFAMNGEEVLIYLPAYWEELLDLLQYIANDKNQLLVISGHNGSGKSVLAELLIAQLGDNVHIAKISAEPNLNANRLVEFLSDSFLIPWQIDQEIDQALDEQLQAFQHKEKNCLLLIDNAQLLPTETLEALLYLIGQQSEHQMRFHAVLLGESNIQQTLQRMLEPDEESLVHFLTLDPLSLDETKKYLHHRLSAAGWQNDYPMTEEIIARIYRLSEGNPARINRIARRFLLDLLNQHQGASRHDSWLSQYRTHLIGAGLLVLILSGLGLWIWHENLTPHAVALAPAVAPIAPASDTQPTVTINGQETQTMTVKPEETAALASPATPQVEHPTETPPVNQEAPPRAEENTRVAALTPTMNHQNNKEVPVIAPAEAPTIENNKGPLANASLQQSQPQDSVQPITNTKIKPLKGKQANSVQAGDYTIQLLSLSHKNELAKFIKNNHLEGKVQIVTHKVHGKTVTAVYYGHYKTMHDAEQAIAQLPPSLLDAAPWPKKID